MAFPVLYIVAVATLFDISLNSCGKILLSPSYYLVSGFAVISGYGLWEMRRWSWFLFMASQGLITAQTAVLVFGYAESHHRLFAFVISIFFQLGLIKRVASEIFVPYLFPRIRWWESNPRYKFSAIAQIVRKSGETQDGEILDISGAGCFIKLRNDLDQDESISLIFSMLGETIRCKGLVVWLTESAVIHPRGIGVKFTEITKSQKRALRIISKKLKKIAYVYRRYRYLTNQDEFLKQLEKVGG
ncbi:MAG: PilZ domain-containing protein [Bdellovibrionia bacterium]